MLACVVAGDQLVAGDVQELLFEGTSLVLFYDAPERARPSGVNSVSVHENRDNDDTAETATTGSASVETTPDTTFDAAAGEGQANPRLCPVAATTGMTVGRRLLLTNATAETEWAEVAEIDSGVSFTARHPLHNTYASGDTVESTRIQITMLDAWVADENNISGADQQPHARYRAKWNYTVAGVVHVADQYFDVVRYPSGADIAPLDVERMVPGWLARLTTNVRQTQGVTVIAEAAKQVGARMTANKQADQLIREANITNYLIALKADELQAYAHYRAGGVLEQYEVARERFNTVYNDFVNVVHKLPTSTDSSGAARNVKAQRITRR